MKNQEMNDEAFIGGSGLNAGLGEWISIKDKLPDEDGILSCHCAMSAPEDLLVFQCKAS